MRMRTAFIAISVLTVTALPAPGDTMYGSGSGQQNGEFGIVDQMTALFTVLGDPTVGALDGYGLNGIAFDESGRLWGSAGASSQSGVTRLSEINPVTGQLINDVGPIQDAQATGLRIVDLALQPSTNVLFGIDRDSLIYTIDKLTAVATLVGNPNVGDNRGGIAFGPDGTFYLIPGGGGILYRLNPATAATIGMGLNLDEGDCIDGLAVRPNDGILFATECDGRDIFRIDPITGDADPIDPGDEENDVADLAFRLHATPAPALSVAAMATLAGLLALAGLGITRRRSRPAQSLRAF